MRARGGHLLAQAAVTVADAVRKLDALSLAVAAVAHGQPALEVRAVFVESQVDVLRRVREAAGAPDKVACVVER